MILNLKPEDESVDLSQKIRNSDDVTRDYTIEQKIGQMLMVGFRGLSIEKESIIVNHIIKLHLGGVILFDYDVPTQKELRNIRSPQQLADLTTALQEAASVPLFIGVDQEGGEIARLKPKNGFAATVSHRRLGERDCLSMTRSKSEELAQTLARTGVNLNFAPCGDLDKNPQNPVIGAKERSFSHQPHKVVAHAVEFIKAHHRQGVLCVLKHFPGHGSSRQDSHLGMVDVTETWGEEELIPYEKLIDLGLADAIMTAHVFHKEWDENHPATLSHPVVTKMLREKLHFTGVVFSDDLQMGAIASHFGAEAAIEAAINAGVDVLMFANNSSYDENIAEKAALVIKKLLALNKITQNRIDDSFRRIMTLKKKLLQVC